MKKQPLTLCGNKAEIPTETHLVILCLDYLMDLRRQTDADVLKGKKHLDADFISLAVFALSRSVLRPDYLSLANKKDENIFDPKCTTHHKIPHISKINEEIMTPSKYYPRPSDPNYHDLHPTNLYRFYRLDGLAAGGPHSGPLKLSDLVDAGLKKTNSRCRLEAEKEIVKSSQFELYIQSVTSRGYFRDPTNSGKRSDPKEEDERRARKNQVYKEKYRKAIAKYREKLALNIDHSASADQMEMLSPPHSPSIRMSSPRTPTKSSSRHNNRAFNSPTREAFNSPVRDYPVPSEVHMSPRTHVTSSTRKSKTVGRSTGATSSTPTTSANAATTPLQAKSTKVAATTSPAKVTTNHNRAKVTTTNNSTKGTTTTNLTKPQRTLSISKVEPSPQEPKLPKTSSSPGRVKRNCSTSSIKPAEPAVKAPKRYASSSNIMSKTSGDSCSVGASSTGTKSSSDSPRSTLAKMASSRRRSRVPSTRMPSQEPQKKTTQDSSNEDPQQKTASPASPSDIHQEAPRGRTSRRKSVIGRRASRRVSDVQSFSPQPPPPPPQQPNTFSPVQSYAPTKQKLEAMLSPATTGSNAENQPPQAKKMETKPLSPEIEVKVKAFSLYEMNLASSGSSGLEANAGSFASTCITVISPGIPSPGISSPGTRRRKSEYEKKIEEQKRWSCPETLALPDIAASEAEKPKGKLRPKSINTSREQGVEDDHDRTPQRKGRPSPSDFDKGHKSPKSPIARVRNEQEKQRKTEQLNKLRYGTANPINNKTDEGVVSPRRLKLVGSQDDTSWISVPPHQTSPKPNHAMENTPQVQTSRTPNDKIHSTVKKKAAVFQSSATNAASQRFSFDRAGGRNNTNNKDDKTSKSPSTRSRKSPIHRPRKSPNNRSGKIRMPGISSPKADFKLDPFKITPPSFLGGSRLFNATATNDSETSKPGNKLASPRGVLQSSSPQNFGKPSSLKRAC